MEGAGLSVARSTYAFGAVFPLFVAERARRRMQKRRTALASVRRLHHPRRVPDEQPGPAGQAPAPTGDAGTHVG